MTSSLIAMLSWCCVSTFIAGIDSPGKAAVNLLRDLKREFSSFPALGRWGEIDPGTGEAAERDGAIPF